MELKRIPFLRSWSSSIRFSFYEQSQKHAHKSREVECVYFCCRDFRCGCYFSVQSKKYAKIATFDAILNLPHSAENDAFVSTPTNKNEAIMAHILIGSIHANRSIFGFVLKWLNSDRNTRNGCQAHAMNKYSENIDGFYTAVKFKKKFRNNGDGL